MTREECLAFYKELTKLADARFVPYYKMAIEALEKQSCEDCINREKAKQFLYERLDRLNNDELYDIFSRIIDDMYNELPSVKPATDNNVLTCEDAVSRQAAIDCLNADFTIDGKENMETVVDYINGAFKQIKALPSVTPKQKVGHWIAVENEEMETVGYYCSECDLPMETEQRTFFCPNCGAKMEVE